MSTIKDIIKFKIAPKKLYQYFSSKNKYNRAYKKGEVELRLLPFLADPNKTAIDIGANNGLYTYFLAKNCKDVKAFEPHEILYKFLVKASPENVTVINKGLSDITTTADFHIPVINGKEHFNISSFEPKMVKQHKTIIRKIDIVPLDSYEYQNVGFIKIDVEGHEINVLKGAAQTIEQSRPVVQIEILADQYEVSEHEVVCFLRDKGYQMLCLQDNLLRIFRPSDTHKSSRNFIFLPVS